MILFPLLVDTKERISESTSHEVEAYEELIFITVSFKVLIISEGCLLVTC